MLITTQRTTWTVFSEAAAVAGFKLAPAQQDHIRWLQVGDMAFQVSMSPDLTRYRLSCTLATQPTLSQVLRQAGRQYRIVRPALQEGCLCILVDLPASSVEATATGLIQLAEDLAGGRAARSASLPEHARHAAAIFLQSLASAWIVRDPAGTSVQFSRRPDASPLLPAACQLEMDERLMVLRTTIRPANQDVAVQVNRARALLVLQLNELPYVQSHLTKQGEVGIAAALPSGSGDHLPVIFDDLLFAYRLGKQELSIAVQDTELSRLVVHIYEEVFKHGNTNG
ncbi:MAG: hypothetical protein JXJ17_01795 [Anaerolineae bacterium]|nr:hypothetical protein [Anaerolineae bacterium]